MQIERLPIDEPTRPFPIHADLVDRVLAAQVADLRERDATTAHLLGTLAAYAYADAPTVATMLSRLGLGGGACVRLEQSVDAMFVFSTAYLAQSRCGRLVVLGYRGTEPTNLANWLGDADVGPDSMAVGDARLAVHAGFLRNLRATRWNVLEELDRALAGRSLLDPECSVEHPLETLLVTGHSLGGAMAVLFALALVGDAERGALVESLRAIYTFGQPLATAAPLPESARGIARKLVRHVLPRDPVPALPTAPWGRLAHFGREYRFADDAWSESATPVAQLRSARALSRSFLAFFVSAKRRNAARYSLAEHVPHQYLAALRPRGRVTELGDPG